MRALVLVLALLAAACSSGPRACGEYPAFYQAPLASEYATEVTAARYLAQWDSLPDATRELWRELSRRIPDFGLRFFERGTALTLLHRGELERTVLVRRYGDRYWTATAELSCTLFP